MFPQTPASAKAQFGSLSFLPTDEYVSRLPSPPSIDIPPPLSNPVQHWKLPLSSEYNFLRGFSFSNLQEHGAVVTGWSFNNRRQAQRILPFIYLGPITCSRSEEFLKSEGITKIVSIPQLRTSSSVPASGPLRPGAAEELGIEIQNTVLESSQKLVQEFSALIRSMNEHLSQRKDLALQHQDSRLEGNILVCCQTGNDKSAALVVAYLMETLHLSLEEAAQVVNLQRFSIDLNQPLKVVLRAYEAILQAKRSVAQDSVTIPTNCSEKIQSPQFLRSHKRRMDSLDSMDMTAEDTEPSDVPTFSNRNFTPFM